MYFLRFFSSGKKNIIVQPQLGRWKLNDNIKRKIDLANIDNCGDDLCGIPIGKELKAVIEKYDIRWYNNKDIKKDIGGQTFQTLVDDYNRRWKKSLTIKEFKEKI